MWNDPENARKLSEERKSLQNIINRAQSIDSAISDMAELMEIIDADSSEYGELFEEYERIEAELRQFEIESYLSGEDDRSDAVLEIHSGAGGTEAQDWANMLLRMYLRFFERRGWNATIIDKLEGEEAGIKSAVVEVHGEFAYGYLKSEIGVHRLVRISPFDANRRRHTSFASVFVYPITEESTDVEINDKDLKIDRYRASGHGGQNVNKVETAIRITHIPTGVVVTCQAERSQHKNLALAMKLLRAKLLAIKKKEEEEKQGEIEKQKMKIEWGSQIRSYVLHPYKMVKDLRTQYETSQAEKVLDGELDPFIEEFLTMRKNANV